MTILLERRLVKILENYTIANTDGITRQDFVTHLSNKRWPRVRYFRLQADEFSNKIQHTLYDCIEGYKFIREENGVILVTTKGRDFIKIPLGFSEDFLKRRSRTVVGMIAVAVSIFALLLNRFH